MEYPRKREVPESQFERPKKYHDLKINYPYRVESMGGEDYYVVDIEPLDEFGVEKKHLTGIDFIRVCQEIVIDISKDEGLEGDGFEKKLLKEHHGYYDNQVRFPQENTWTISLNRETLEDNDRLEQYKWTFELNEGAFKGYLIGNWYYSVS